MATRQRNHGLRKTCDCPRRAWPKCPHPWKVNLKHAGVHHRLTLNTVVGQTTLSKADAIREWDALKVRIRAGQWPPASTTASAAPATAGDVTFRQLARLWIDRERTPLVATGELSSVQRDLYLLGRWYAVELEPGLTLGDRPVGRLTLDDLEVAFVAVTAGKAGSTANKYRQQLMHLQTYALENGYVDRAWLTAKKKHAIRRKRGARRYRRLVPDVVDAHGQVVKAGEERRLLAVADPPLQRLIITALDTCTRAGELLSLQWKDVDLPRRRLFIRAEHCKTEIDRWVQLSDRVVGILHFLRTDPAGKEHAADRYVFGNAVGEQVKTYKKTWETTKLLAYGEPVAWVQGKGRLAPESRAALKRIDLHFHDLRHEGASRLQDRGWPLYQIARFLGHRDVKTTSIYLNADDASVDATVDRFGLGPLPLHGVASDRQIDHAPGVQPPAPRSPQLAVN